MLLLCVDALFSRHGGVVECEWNIPWKREVCSRYPKEVQDERHRYYALLLMHGGVEECIWAFPWSRKVYSRDFEEILNAGL